MDLRLESSCDTSYFNCTLFHFCKSTSKLEKYTVRVVKYWVVQWDSVYQAVLVFPSNSSLPYSGTVYQGQGRALDSPWKRADGRKNQLRKRIEKFEDNYERNDKNKKKEMHNSQRGENITEQRRLLGIEQSFRDESKAQIKMRSDSRRSKRNFKW